MGADSKESEGGPPNIRGFSELERAAIIETSIQQAIRRGEFDDLPGAGKPLTGLDGKNDPDWWIKQKIRNEDLTGLGPPALSLRVENAELDDRLDALGREQDVREALADFNARVVSARRQLQGGPPVVTPTRDVDAEVSAWHARRAARRRAAQDAASTLRDDSVQNEPKRRRGWFRRRK